jgi:hypothetical protein
LNRFCERGGCNSSIILRSFSEGGLFQKRVFQKRCNQDTEDRLDSAKMVHVSYFIISINDLLAESDKKSIDNYNGPADEGEERLPF